MLILGIGLFSFQQLCLWQDLKRWDLYLYGEDGFHALDQGIQGKIHGSTNKSVIGAQGKWEELVPILRGVYHLHQDPFYVFIGDFHCTWTVGRVAQSFSHLGFCPYLKWALLVCRRGKWCSVSRIKPPLPRWCFCRKRFLLTWWSNRWPKRYTHTYLTLSESWVWWHPHPRLKKVMVLLGSARTGEEHSFYSDRLGNGGTSSHA